MTTEGLILCIALCATALCCLVAAVLITYKTMMAMHRLVSRAEDGVRERETYSRDLVRRAMAMMESAASSHPIQTSYLPPPPPREQPSPKAVAASILSRVLAPVPDPTDPNDGQIVPQFPEGGSK